LSDAVQRVQRRRPRGRRRLALALALVPGGLGCSATVLRPETCEDSSECRAAFGLGSTCGSDGYCTAPQSHPRCTQAYPANLLETPHVSADRLVIGSLFGFVDHRDTMLAAELAIRQLDQLEGIDGTELAILHCDTTASETQTDLEATASAATFLADVIGVPAIVGPRGSARTQTAFESVRDSGVLVISPSATSAELTAIDAVDPTFEAPGLLWRTVPPDTLQAEVIASDMRERAVLRVAVIYQTGSYGDGLSALFEDRFVALGGTEVQRHPFTDGQFGTIVADVGERLGADEVHEVLFLSSDIADYIDFLLGVASTDDLLASYTADGVGVFLADAAYNTMLLEATAATADMVYPHIRGTRPAPADGVYFNAFAAAYAAEFAIDAEGSGFTPHSYDAAWLVAYGSAWSLLTEGSVSGTGIARGLRKVSGGESVAIQPPSWGVVLERFATGTPIDVEGASGPLDYDPDTEETSAPIELWSIVADPEATSGWGFVALERIDPT